MSGGAEEADERSAFEDANPGFSKDAGAATRVAAMVSLPVAVASSPPRPAEASQPKAEPTSPASLGTPPPFPEPEADPEPPPHYHGHRDRVRERFRRTGGEAFLDYELLELLLFRALPRQDTKPKAKALLKRFGSLAEVLGAPLHLLKEVEGIGEAAALDLKIIAAAAQRMGRGEIAKRELLTSWDAVLNYCRTAMAFEEKEQFRVLFLNKKNLLIADEIQQKGTVDHTPAYPREVVQRAVNLGATAIILVHNHPSGDPSPSRADIELTRTIAAVSKGMNVMVLDHVIVGRDGHASLKALGYI